MLDEDETKSYIYSHPQKKLNYQIFCFAFVLTFILHHIDELISNKIFFLSVLLSVSLSFFVYIKILVMEYSNNFV